MRRAVISFINVASGRYRWWDEFPLMLGARLSAIGIEHVCFYREYEAASPQPAEDRHPTPEGSLASAQWLEHNVRPVAGRYEQVILHTHGHYRPIELWRETRRHPRAQWFWTEHQISEPRRLDPLRKLGRCVGQRRGRFPTRVFGVSEAGATRLKQQFSASTVECIRTGIHVQDPVSWDGSNAGTVPRKALFVGRLIAGKGIWPLLKAMVLLKEKGSEIHLTLVGRGMTDEVNAYIRDNNLLSHVTLAGHQLDVEPYYREADFVIIPTLVREALGMVSLEARRYALPVIYCNRGGLPETQIDGLTGLMLASPTAEEIARAILSLQSDPARYARMRQRAPIGLDEFSIEKMVQSYVGQYESALASFQSASLHR
jgi:glycosyltransferase involved in cell wall biosynthesis